VPGLPSLDLRQPPELIAVWETCSQKCGKTTLFATSLPFRYKFACLPPIRDGSAPTPEPNIGRTDDLVLKSADRRSPAFPPMRHVQANIADPPRELAADRLARWARRLHLARSRAAQWIWPRYQFTTGLPTRADSTAPAARNVPKGIGVRRPALPMAIMATPTMAPRTLAKIKPRKA
jgi:hypothetical protein